MRSSTVATSPSKSILYIVPSTSIGGAETFIRQTAQFHRRERYRPVYALLRHGVLASYLNELGVAVFAAPHLTRLSRPHSVIATLNWLNQLIDECEIELIHSTMAYGCFFGAPAAWRAKIPHLWFQHGPCSGWMASLAGALPAQALIVNSEFTKGRQRAVERLVPGALHRHRKVLLLPLGVDLKSIALAAGGPASSAIRAAWAFPPAACVFGMLCRIQELKGIDLFIEALRRAQSRTSVPLAGVVFGGTPVGETPTSLELRLHEQARRAGVRFIFSGPTDRPWEAIHALDALVSSSQIPEAFGLSIIEGMAAGKTVIAPDEGGPLEIIHHQCDGLLFKARDLESLASTIVRVGEDAELRRKIGQTAYAAAQSRFGAQTSIRSLEDFYDTLI